MGVSKSFCMGKKGVLKEKKNKNRGMAILRRKVFDIRGMGKAKKEVDNLGGSFSRKIKRFCEKKKKKKNGARKMERKKTERGSDFLVEGKKSRKGK